MKALISGFYISGDAGKQLAQIKELQNSSTVWSLPVFSLSFIENPAPLLLYDEILTDEQVAPLTIDYIYHNIEQPGAFEDANLARQSLSPQELERRAEILSELFNTQIFRTIRMGSLLTQNDIAIIGRNARAKIEGRNDWFQGEVDQLKLVYGANYASPNPLSFEAMNTELLWQISEKLSEEDSDITIFDDCVRGNLYKAKIYELVSESTRRDVVTKFFAHLPTYVVGLPKIRLQNVESFLELHQSNALNDFRQIVTAISLESDSHRRDRMIHNELYRANDAILSNTNDADLANLFGVVLNLGVTAASFIQNTHWLTGFGFASASFLMLSVLKQARERLSKRQKFNWFVRLKSFAEKQAGYNEPLQIPWHLPDL